MSKNVQQLILGATLLAIGLFIGRMIGVGETYKKTSGDVTKQYFRGVATNLNSHLQLLELVKTNQQEKLSQKLENLVNADMMALDRYDDVPAKERNPEIEQLIQRARAYKQKQGAGTPAK